MFLVDNFKILLLVGLICTAGIPSSSAFKCKGTGDTAAGSDCPPDHLCLIGKNGEKTGCGAPKDTANCTATMTALLCDKAFGCCCASDDCDDLTTGSPDELCKIDAIKYEVPGNCTGVGTTGTGPVNGTGTGTSPATGTGTSVKPTTTTAHPALTCVKAGQPENCKAGTVCKILKDGTQEGCAAVDADCKAGPLECGAYHCCCGDGSDCNAVEPNSAFCTKFPTVMGCSSGSSSTSVPIPVVCSKDSTPCAPGQVCKIDREGKPAGCTPVTKDCKAGPLRCRADMCCCSRPPVKCDSEKEYSSFFEVCKHSKLREKLKETTCRDPTTTDTDTGSAAAGLFQHFYGGLPLLAFLSAQKYLMSIKSLL